MAIDLPWELRERLISLVGGLPAARWLPPENLHLTLRFIGEVTPNQAEDVDMALAGLQGRRFALSLSGVATLNRSGREVALRAGTERNAGLDQLQAKIETALQRAGLPSERRRFIPHVTMARLESHIDEGRLASYLQSRNLFRAGPVEVSHFTLFRSQLGKEASAYTAEVEYPLV